MRNHNSKETKSGSFFAFCGALVILPVLLISLFFYIFLYVYYVAGSGRQRVMDIRRMGAPLLKGAMLLGAVMALVFLGIIDGAGGQPPQILLWIVAGLGGAVALHLAVIYLGVVGDPEHDRLFFPPDMQSYGILDYLLLRFIVDYCRVDSIPLSAIKRITRGHGTEVYLHGNFGSRGIFFSSKQKRDECMVMIQSLTNKRGLVFGELESY